MKRNGHSIFAGSECQLSGASLCSARRSVLSGVSCLTAFCRPLAGAFVIFLLAAMPLFSLFASDCPCRLRRFRCLIAIFSAFLTVGMEVRKCLANERRFCLIVFRLVLCMNVVCMRRNRSAFFFYFVLFASLLFFPFSRSAARP